MAEICESNGLARGASSYPSATTFEMFMYNYPQARALPCAPRAAPPSPLVAASLELTCCAAQMLGLRAFPALKSIFIAQQTLSRLAGLEACPCLEARSRPGARGVAARPLTRCSRCARRACGWRSAR
jgi:hypothetical protein